jgi:hypothetical protein
MRVPIRSLNFGCPGTGHHRDNLVSIEQERADILSRIVPFAELDQRHRSSPRFETASFVTQI